MACAAALASLEVFAEDQVLEHLQPKIALLTHRLRTDIAALPHVADIRHWGLMVGIELMRDPTKKLPMIPLRKSACGSSGKRASTA